jgi:hypothetical protein
VLNVSVYVNPYGLCRHVKYKPYGSIVKWLRQRTFNPSGLGSNPSAPTIRESIYNVWFDSTPLIRLTGGLSALPYGYHSAGYELDSPAGKWDHIETHKG